MTKTESFNEEVDDLREQMRHSPEDEELDRGTRLESDPHA